MTRSRTILLSAALGLGLSGQALAADGWGASWSFGPVRPTTSNHIVYSKTTLVPGRLASTSSSTGPLFIWPGLSNPTSDLVQTTADAWQDNASACGAKAGQWCLEASVFGSFGQRSGPSVAIDPDDHITIEYKLESDNTTWTQTVTSLKLAKVVSTLQSKSGLMLGGGFGFATEADADAYTVDAQYYLCTEIHLAAADPQFGTTGVGGTGAKYGATGTGSGPGTAKNLRTPDNGLTWLVDLITLPAMNPQGAQTPPPEINCGSSGTGGSGAGGTSGAGGAGGAIGRRDGGVDARASGGANGSGGAGSGGRLVGVDASAAGGTVGSGGVGGGGHASGTGGGSSGGAVGSGGKPTGTGGASASSGGVAGASAGNGGTSGSSRGGASGSGGAGTGGDVRVSSGSGGTAGPSTGAVAESSGCSCSLGTGSRGGFAGFMLLLGGLVAGLLCRSRARPSRITPTE